MYARTKSSCRTASKPALVFRRILRILGIAAAAVLLLFTIAEYRPAPSEALTPDGTSSAVLNTGDSLTVMTWNLGYCALDETADFFMDGGSPIMKTTAQQIMRNLEGIRDEIQTINPDILFLQEVDQDSARSRHVNEKAFLQEAFPEYQSTFANNYRTLFVPFPLPPIGKVNAGLLSFSRYPLSSSTRIQLPVSFPWPIRTFNLKRCLDIERIPVTDSEHELVIINLHLEAYDRGGGKIAQTNILRDYLNEEYDKGNYVIAGGDFNQIFSHVDASAYPVLNNRWQPGRINIEDIGNTWQFIMDTAVPSSRLLDRPYKDADHDSFQYYLIDGFIVSDNLEIESYHTEDLQFAWSDHNPVIMKLSIPQKQE